MVDAPAGSIGEVHRKASREVRPDQVQLARRWKILQKRWSFGVFNRFPNAYEEVLGAEGLNEWQRGENGPNGEVTGAGWALLGRPSVIQRWTSGRRPARTSAIDGRRGFELVRNSLEQ